MSSSGNGRDNSPVAPVDRPPAGPGQADLRFPGGGRRLQAIIFDCDGVLFDSRAANVAFYDAVFREVTGEPLPPEWHDRVHVLASTDVYDELFGRGTEASRRARQVARELGYDPFFALMRPVDGLHTVLASLARACRLGMATNRRSTTREVVRRFGLNRYLRAAVGAADVERPKPAPDMLLLCARLLEVEPARCLYVGDAPADRQAAEQAGIPFAGVGEVPGAPITIGTLTDLPPLLGLALSP